MRFRDPSSGFDGGSSSVVAASGCCLVAPAPIGPVQQPGRGHGRWVEDGYEQVADLRDGQRDGIPAAGGMVRVGGEGGQEGMITRWPYPFPAGSATRSRSQTGVLGEPDRSPLPITAAVHRRQLQPPQPHRADARPARLPALAQQERPPSRRAGRPTTRTCPHPQREGHPLGRTPDRRGCMTKRPSDLPSCSSGPWP